jgi:DNA-binding NtrC family response regulator
MPPATRPKDTGEEDEQGGSLERRTRIRIPPLSLATDAPIIEGMVGASASMTQLAADIHRLARRTSGVLITGAHGTGKSVVARAIHDASPRRGRAWIAVNCAALPKDLIEKLLFGHERGAFTGAGERQAGFFEAADGGTLLLDEIAEIPTEVQAKLLTAIETKEFFRVGGTSPVRCDVRIIAATKRDLDAMILSGEFGEDLYYRLRVLRVRVPSLDERRDDIPALTLNALEKHKGEEGRPTALNITDEAMRLLVERPWPGNVRELENAVIEIASHVEDERDEITAEDVRKALGEAILEVGERDGDARQLKVPAYIIGEDLDHYLDRTLIDIYNTLLRQCGSVERVAALLGCDRRTLSQRLLRIEERLAEAADGATRNVKRLRLAKGSKKK